MPTETRFTETFPEAPPTEIEMAQPVAFHTLKLSFSPAIAFRVYDEFDRNSIEPQPDGSTRVTATLPVDSWIVSYLLSFGPEVTILEPPELRAQVTELAKKIYEHHNA